MATYDRYTSREVVGRVWQQIQKSLVSDDGRLRQLLSLKPINLYDKATSFETSGAVVKMEIKSYLENLLTKRAKSGINLWPFGWGTQDSLNYKFNVVVDGKMDYPNMEIWIRNNFKDKLYAFRNGRYHLKLRDVKRISSRDKKLILVLDLFGSIRIWKFRFKQKSVLTLEMDPIYDPKNYIIRAKNVDYNFETPNLLLKVLDKYYHDDFKEYIEEIIEVSIKEDLFSARIQAQEVMNQHQKDEKLIFNGILKDLEMERIEIQQKGIKAVFLAQGNIQLTR